MAKILVSRLSAMGDVAMLIPILYGVAIKNPEHEFTLLTQPFFANLLLCPPPNVEVMVIDTKGEEKHVWGLFRYVDRLIDERFDYYIDAHNVLRTKLIRLFLWFRRVRVCALDKPRKARRRLLAHSSLADLVPVPSMHGLYVETFRKAGLRIPDSYSPILIKDSNMESMLRIYYPEAFSTSPLVGIAPFASTDSKTYDLDAMEQVVASLSKRGVSIYLFGGRGKEAELLDQWEKSYQGVRSLADRLDLSDELYLMGRLSVMVSMDSANMHFASMLGIPVISVWCATHPSAGFLGLGQREEDCVQAESMDCRPCSIFGKVKRCIHGNMPCRFVVPSEQITSKVIKYIE